MAGTLGRTTAIALLLLAPGAATAATGGELFTANCATCHGAEAKGGIGPNITCKTDVLTTVRTGKGVTMPAFPASILPDADVSAIQGFLAGLCSAAGGAGDACGSVDECRLALAAVLPTASSARSVGARRVTRALGRLR